MATTQGMYSIEHRSIYQYSSDRTSCVMLLCLKPKNNVKQRVEAFDLNIEPMTQPVEYEDFLGNECHLINIHRPHDSIIVKARSLVSLNLHPKSVLTTQMPEAQVDFGGYAELWDYQTPSQRTTWINDLEAFLCKHKLNPGGDISAALHTLERVIHENLQYVPQSTTVDTSIEEVLHQGRGVCQDFAHIMIAIARHWGVPSRYVMGYLIPGAATDISTQESHAWLECLLPDQGWVSFDPTNPDLDSDGYITVAYGRDFGDVSPTKGLNTGLGEESLGVDVQVCAL